MTSSTLQGLSRRSLNCCGGEDRSTINLHLPGWLFFGITPNGLTWAGIDPTSSGRIAMRRPFVTSSSMYLSTTSGLLEADPMLLGLERSSWAKE